MPRPKAPPRVAGPYAERGGTRFRIRILGDGSAKNLYFPTMEEARARKAEAEQQLVTPQRQQLGELIDAFFAEREQLGTCRKETIANERERLRYFLSDIVDSDIHTITAQRASAMYESAIMRPSVKTGKPLEAASHRFYLGIAKRFFAWATKQGVIPRSPFQDVRPQGRPKAGKPQLQVEEAHRFVNTALKLFDEENESLALAAVLTLLLGLRASQVLQRRVRDVEKDTFWISDSRSEHNRRALRVPSVLEERLHRLCIGKEPELLLFGGNSKGQPRHHRVLWSTVREICQRAQVPKVCTHSLRSLWSTLSAENDARSARVLNVLDLAAPKESVPTGLSLPSAKEDDPIGEQEAAQLLATLSRSQINKLLQLARRESESG